MLLKLKSLSFGDTIGIISPASPTDDEVLNKGIRFFEDLGFKIKKGKFIECNCGYLAGSDKLRAYDLMDMFLDKYVNMILCIRGGYGCMRILPYINFNVIKSNPKIFCGFSDITCLLNSISSNCNFPTFHGPMLTSKFQDDYTRYSFFNMFIQNNNVINDVISSSYYSVHEDIVEGTLVGGNLSLICSTLGTPYELNTNNKILLIEEIGESPYRVDRLLTQLLLANKLQRCKAIIVGYFTKCTSTKYNVSVKCVLKELLYPLNIPLLINFMSGHDYPNLTLPIGSKIILNCYTKQIKIANNIFYK